MKQYIRFIPARAGNIKSLSTPCLTITVHPRACGEHRDGLDNVGMFGGSSPRVRGTSLLGIRDTGHRRFIPARAGNMYTRRWRTIL